MEKNPLNCGFEQKAYFEWILSHKELQDRVIGAQCSDGTSLWKFNWNQTESHRPVCNANGEYDGQYGIKKWPPVPSGQYSTVNCPTGDGVIRWNCLEDGKFDNKGPEFEECWLDGLLEKNITSVEDVIQSLEEMIKMTSDKSSLNSMTSLGKVNKIVVKLEDFLKDTTIESFVAQNISESFVQVYSQTIDQSLAWDNGTGIERRNTASQVLLHIQRTAFLTNCYLNSENNSKEFFSNNLYEKLLFNLTESIVFEYNSSSISIPPISDFGNIETEDSCRGDSSMGALISTLDDYLNEGLDHSLRINSEIIAFSLRNSNESHSIENNSYVRVRYTVIHLLSNN